MVPLRITFVLPHASMAGGTRVVARYAELLRCRGHRVVAVSTRRDQYSLAHRLKSLLRGRGWPVVPETVPCHFDGLAVEHRRLSRRRPVRAADLPDADVVVATWWETAEWVAALPPAKGAKVHFIQDYEVWGGHRRRVDATCRLPMPKITPARWVRDLLVARFGAGEVTVIPNCIDPATFDAPPRDKQPTPTVGFVYTPFRNKGADLCVEAYRLAAARLPGLKLVTFGLIPPTPELPLPAGPGFDVEFHRDVPEEKLREIYARCDAWLFGTRVEGFGLPAMEAMACRTPVIGTPAGAVPELLAEGGGVLVPHEDPAAMAEAIARVGAMAGPAWREMSARAHAAAHRCTWEKAAERFEAALLAAAGGARGIDDIPGSVPVPGTIPGAGAAARSTGIVEGA